MGKRRPEPVRPTREQFLDYINIKNSHEVDMFDVYAICEASKSELTVANCYYIEDHFISLLIDYEVTKY